jgi:branched-chain amino acid transport system substrate-binding protein
MKALRRMSVAILIVTLAAMLLACGAQPYECTDEWGCAVFEKGQTIKLAYVGPMTADYSAFGIDISRGVELAVKDHGAVQGFSIEIVVEDTQGSPEQGAAVANKLSADARVVAVVGHTFSGSTEVAIPIYGKSGIVMMSPSATNPSLTTLGSPVFNRVAFTDELQGQAAANYIYETLGIRKIVVMHDGGAYGQGLAGVCADAFAKLGGTVLGTEAITPGEADYSAPLAAVAALGPELIYYGGYDADAAVLVSQMAGAGLQNAKFFGCDGTYGANYINLAGSAAEGTFSTYVPIPESAAFDKFRADYMAAYGQEQGELSPFSPHGYDSAMILMNAMDKVAVKSGDQLIIPRKALADAVRATANYAGLTGSITCSPVGECAAANIKFMQVQNGAWVVGPGQ